jgi:type IX secretion system PorP/SprF family membrane protein
MRNKLIVLILLALLCRDSFAQQRMNTSLFSSIVTMTQPGWMGTREQTEIIVGARKQWIGWEGAPQSQYIGLSGSLFNNKLGLGVNLAKDQTGARRSNEGNLVMNYMTPINAKGWKLNAGISLGYNRYSFNVTDLLIDDVSDGNLSNYQSKSLFSVGFGCSIQSSIWTVGLYNNRLNNYLQSNVAPENVKLINQWNLFASRSWHLHSLLNLNTSFHYSYASQGKSNAEINGILVYQDILGMGLAYRYHESIGIPVQFRISPQIQILYAYDFPIQQMLKSQAGTHELALNIQLKNKPKAVLNPRFF